ncbi:2-dehydro-3-deoxyphosphogluconate aldolase / (4S)-4-hydroxy-2-oxoglutarate aldolase [Evansella caseinilytica]|uniref:2-dehydro-3-deoxyphosphogluconate aldolase / (4S)-4-hydroxy-2-oxoglutarate aldolase n=1 Tax=Evansella caseinilytica TaxID=1503961 RepID=A0A1H3UWT6_9BACI|nr:bifunctional 4-hydroxy-2-oxoglutarate aldolase/2-dehydro-3-deoxy-phosphogluconate aldolase [Evansella caseinilytica]SDZ66883.1 2-dehydro-3-deoxyphosphogluconate aldolase / (4S)-4-hydroxy-2-oxoglutarate aldolase [Evansella caseinilytica]
MQSKQLQLLTGPKAVAVIRKVDRSKVIDVIEALIKGGITGIEVTMDSDDALGVIGEAKEKFHGRAAVGAGTVLDEKTAEEAIRAGAEFIFAPTLDRETIKVTKQHGKISIPGVFTPTEMLQAYNWGADMVKVFPASVVGPQFVKDVRGPLGYIPIIVTGGINAANYKAFLQAGAVAVGVGGSLLNKDYIANGDFAKITALAKEYTG